MSQEEQIKQLSQQVEWLLAQVANLYGRLQLPYATTSGVADNHRTDVGMGPIVSPDKTSFL